MNDRARRQLDFVRELEKAKLVYRQCEVVDSSRRENDAEHMWHLALMAIVLAEHAEEPVDLLKVVTMLLVHDVVEIDAGDAFVYDEAARAGKAERERAAAERIFGLLPDDQAEHLRAAWEEFEARETPEARFAASIDRLQPLLLNAATKGAPWQRHGITSDRVLRHNAHIADGSAELWDVAQSVIADAVSSGALAAPPVAGT